MPMPMPRSPLSKFSFRFVIKWMFQPDPVPIQHPAFGILDFGVVYP